MKPKKVKIDISEMMFKRQKNIDLLLNELRGLDCSEKIVSQRENALKAQAWDVLLRMIQ